MSAWNIYDRPIKLGVVGCGRISKNHFAAIEQHADLQLAAVCDTQQDALQTTMKAYNVPGFHDYQEMLTQDLDAIVICTPSGVHPKHAIMAAKAGKHVITEKPMATSWQQGLSMVEACDNAGVRLFVVKQNRRNATLQLLKKAVDEQRFGKIYLANVNVFWTRPQSYYDQAAWRGTWEFDGGAFMNQASHYIDLLHWLIGPVEKVQSMTATLDRKIEAEDTGVINLKWRHGALGSVAVTMLTYPKNLEGSITILGEKGSAKVGGVAVNEIQTWDFETPLEEDKHILEASYETTSVYGFGHPLYYDNVVKAFRGEEPMYTDGREGLKSLELLIAAYQSARDGRTVNLPLER